jgi:hypothetical protein
MSWIQNNTGGGGGGSGFTLNGSSSSVSISAGAGIGIGQANSTITISASVQTSSISISASGNTTLSSSGTFSNGLIFSGAGIVFIGASLNSVTISATTGALPNVVTSLNGSNGSISISAGADIGIGQANSTITISASVQTSSLSITALGNTLGAASTSLAISNALNISGAGVVSVGMNGSTITISAPAAAAGTVSLTALGNTTSSSSGTFNSPLNISGAGIISVGVGNGSITISATTPSVTNFSTISGTLTGNTLGAASTTFTIGNSVSLSGAGIVSVGGSGGTITISASTAALPNVVTSLNGSNGSISISAGAGIGIGQANSTITISASVQTSVISLTGLGNTTLSSSGTYSNLLNVSGAGIVSVGISNGTITVSATTPTATNFSLNGTSSSVSLLAGANIGFASGASSITISAGPLVNSIGAAGSLSSGPITLSGGNNITISSNGAGVILISNGAPAQLSYTANLPLTEVAGTIISTSGTVTGISTSLFLQRIQLDAPMNLSEIDMAMSIAFPNTSQGAGTISRSFVLYSFGNSTSLASSFSTSGTSAWTTGTSTVAGSVSLTEFQGGWSTPLIQPMTFASSRVPAGEYVVGQMFNFSQATSTWTVNIYGGAGNSTSLLTAATALTSATLGALSSGGLQAGSVHTATTSLALTGYSTSAVSGVFNGGTSAFGSLRLLSLTNNTGGVTIGASAAAGVVSGLSTAETGTFTTIAGSYLTAAANINVMLASNSSSANLLSSAGLSAGSFLTASGSISALTNVGLAALGSNTVAVTALPNFGYIGTGSTSTGVIPNAFIAGIFGLGTSAFPTTVALTTTALTQTGSVAYQQPWFALIGS